MKRPELREIPLSEVLPIPAKPEIVITMSQNQWDRFLQNAYEHDCILLELNHNELPVKAYKRKASLNDHGCLEPEGDECST